MRKLVDWKNPVGNESEIYSIQKIKSRILRMSYMWGAKGTEGVIRKKTVILLFAIMYIRAISIWKTVPEISPWPLKLPYIITLTVAPLATRLRGSGLLELPKMSTHLGPRSLKASRRASWKFSFGANSPNNSMLSNHRCSSANLRIERRTAVQ